MIVKLYNNNLQIPEEIGREMIINYQYNREETIKKNGIPKEVIIVPSNISCRNSFPIDQAKSKFESSGYSIDILGWNALYSKAPINFNLELIADAWRGEKYKETGDKTVKFGGLFSRVVPVYLQIPTSFIVNGVLSRIEQENISQVTSVLKEMGYECFLVDEIVHPKPLPQEQIAKSLDRVALELQLDRDSGKLMDLGGIMW